MKVKSKLVLYMLTLTMIFSTNVSCQTKWNGKKIELPKISKQIISMRDNDQDYRLKWMKLRDKGDYESKKYKKTLKKLIEIDRSNTARMKEIINQYGWPTFKKVGEGASNAAWLLVQHADRDPFFQELCLSLLKKELENNQINPSNYAYLYDRVQLAKGKKQLYATQSTIDYITKKGYFQPIEDESNVQFRREKMNIHQHVEDYALSLNFHYKIPSKTEADEKAREYEMLYKTNIDKAKKAIEYGDYKYAAEFYYEVVKYDGYTKAEDYVEFARCISLAHEKHHDLDWNGGAIYLLRAAFSGYQNVEEFDLNPDFKNLKEKDKDFWENDLMTAIDKLKND